VPEHLTSKRSAKKLAASIDVNKVTSSEAVARDIPLTPEKPSTWE
jgi:hypothetical protein